VLRDPAETDTVEMNRGSLSQPIPPATTWIRRDRGVYSYTLNQIEWNVCARLTISRLTEQMPKEF
jgi:hypothetical protein